MVGERPNLTDCRHFSHLVKVWYERKLEKLEIMEVQSDLFWDPFGIGLHGVRIVFKCDTTTDV